MYPKSKKAEISESLFYFRLEIQDRKTKQMTLDKEKYKFMMWCSKKNKEISEVSKFSLWLYPQNRKHANLGKFSFALNFDCFDPIKRRKAENFQ